MTWRHFCWYIFTTTFDCGHLKKRIKLIQRTDIIQNCSRNENMEPFSVFLLLEFDRSFHTHLMGNSGVVNLDNFMLFQMSHNWDCWVLCISIFDFFWKVFIVKNVCHIMVPNFEQSKIWSTLGRNLKLKSFSWSSFNCEHNCKPDHEHTTNVSNVRGYL